MQNGNCVYTPLCRKLKSSTRLGSCFFSALVRICPQCEDIFIHTRGRTHRLVCLRPRDFHPTIAIWAANVAIALSNTRANNLLGESVAATRTGEQKMLRNSNTVTLEMLFNKFSENFAGRLLCLIFKKYIQSGETSRSLYAPEAASSASIVGKFCSVLPKPHPSKTLAHGKRGY